MISAPSFSHRGSNPVLYRTSQQHKNWNRSLRRRPRGSAGGGLSHCCYPIYLTTGAKFELEQRRGCDGMAPKLLSETTHPPPCAALRCYVARSSSAPAQLKLNNSSADGDGAGRAAVPLGYSVFCRFCYFVDPALNSGILYSFIAPYFGHTQLG